MRTRLRELLPYLLMLAADFYLLPLLIRDTGTAMVLTLCAMPVAAFAAGVACGVRQGFRPLLAAAAAVLFLPTLPLYYNLSAWVYAPVYGAVVLLGCGLGRGFYGRR